nr:MAG TPA: capsid fiber protein [Caudoviricetes sp.]
MAMSLTNRRMTPVRGQAAFLPNQPILHNCILSPAETTTVMPGDVMTFDTTQTALDGLIVLKKAAATDVPVGVVVYNAVETKFVANERISIFDTNAYVYMEAGAANLTAGTEVSINATGQVVAATAGQGVIGVVYTAPTAIGDLIAIKVKQGRVAV